MKRLKEAKVTERRANDILRASGREPLPLNDPGVLKDLVKVASGAKLSPVLVVSFDDGAEIAGWLSPRVVDVRARSVRVGPAQDREPRLGVSGRA